MMNLTLYYTTLYSHVQICVSVPMIGEYTICLLLLNFMFLFCLFQILPQVFHEVQSKLSEKCWQPKRYA